ncbi:PREDICTED: uncharacterized protein LOC105545678 [Mandrillus leucophaeus]|uniref:uncharacterized protein LOC105545678 n=1 Tax=Mandrillus leucophaeus TaxID=9568 RepID=UPI0005F41EF8|nr:PREDICTED: uncharacterized protein LOC105545678 [Mandrillus leucophaeus]
MAQRGEEGPASGQGRGELRLRGGDRDLPGRSREEAGVRGPRACWSPRPGKAAAWRRGGLSRSGDRPESAGRWGSSLRVLVTPHSNNESFQGGGSPGSRVSTCNEAQPCGRGPGGGALRYSRGPLPAAAGQIGPEIKGPEFNLSNSGDEVHQK